MENYNISLSLDANNEEEVAEKLESFSKINQALAHEELLGLSEILEEKPGIVKLFRELGEQTEDRELTMISAITLIKNNWSNIKKYLS